LPTYPVPLPKPWTFRPRSSTSQPPGAPARQNLGHVGEGWFGLHASPLSPKGGLLRRGREATGLCRRPSNGYTPPPLPRRVPEGGPDARLGVSPAQSQSPGEGRTSGPPPPGVGPRPGGEGLRGDGRRPGGVHGRSLLLLAWLPEGSNLSRVANWQTFAEHVPDGAEAPFSHPPSCLSWQNSAKPVQDEVPLA
jgi:hypothetical protein